jgi:hypothetical protein
VLSSKCSEDRLRLGEDLTLLVGVPGNTSSLWEFSLEFGPWLDISLTWLGINKVDSLVLEEESDGGPSAPECEVKNGWLL